MTTPRRPSRGEAHSRPGARLAALAALLVGVTAAVAGAAPRPNILLVFLDDHATQAISAYASRINQTPNIDRLAVEGMRFDRCYVPNSICGPCRATVLTGKYSHANGFYVNENQEFDGGQVTFPKLLQKGGYETALIGKWHLVSEPTGFDHWEVLIGQGDYYNPKMIRNGEPIQHTGYTTEIVTDLALDWLRQQRDRDRPFLLMYQHKAPHRPWDPPLESLDLFDDVDLPEPPGLFEDYRLRGAAVRQQDMTIAETMSDRDLKLEAPNNLTDDQRRRWQAAYEPKNAALREAGLSGDDLTRWKYQRYIKDYLRCVKSVDDQLGRVLDYLDEAELADDTIVVYCSDQGFYLGEHGWFDKRWIYEESLRTPLLVRWPGEVAAGRHCDAIVSPLDLASTFLEAAQVDAPSDLQGASLMPLLRGERPADWRNSFYYHYYEFPGWHYVRRHYGVTDGRFKLVHFYEDDVDEWELYDLLLDRDELVNLYDNKAFRRDRERMHAELDRLRNELNVPEADPVETASLSQPIRVRKPDPSD